MATLGEYVEELRKLCGDRRDVDAALVNGVNSACALVWSRELLPRGTAIHEEDVGAAASGYTYVGIPPEMLSVSSVAVRQGTQGFRELPYVDTTLLAGGDAVARSVPAGWTVVGRQVYFLPRVTQGFRVRLVGPRDYPYMTSLTSEVPVPNTLRPLVLTLARSFVALYLGEVEVGQLTATMTRLVDAVALGMHGGAQVLRSEGVKVHGLG